MRKCFKALSAWTCALVIGLLCTATAEAQAPAVRVMPEGVKTTTKHTAYAWAGQPLTVWGSVTWSASSSGNYDWDFGDSSPHATGVVVDNRDIAVSHTYGTAGTYYATLSVSDGAGGSGQAQVRIDVLPNNDGQAAINLAIERGLKYLYLTQSGNGSWSNEPAQTALSLLAFENRGHQPISSTSDIYRDSVVAGLNYAFTTLITQPATPGWQPVDFNGNGVMVGQYSPYCNDESFYPHGMIMMALVAAGPYDRAYPATDAVHNPALNLQVPGSVPAIGGSSYYRVLQDMVEFAAWAQADPGNWGRGGWRYCPNDGEADNSVGQWPAIGLEAAEQWGIVAPSWVKTELRNYWLGYSYNSAYGGWGYDGSSLLDIAHSGAGLSMMAYAGIPKTDPWAVQALRALADHWSGDLYYTWDGGYWPYWPSHYGSGYTNFYAMYGVAKAMRIARDAMGAVSEINQIVGTSTTIDWYAQYANYLLSIQGGSGEFPGWWYWSTDIATPFSILILEPTVASLRPQANIVASPNPVHASTTVNFDISGSTHQDPVRYLASWKIDFDAANGVNWATPDVQGVFPVSGVIAKAGGYPETGGDYDVTATVQVTDNVGETAEWTVIVHITSSWVAPIAAPGGPYFGSIGIPIVLNGSGSYSPNVGGLITLYEWDLNGDGTFEVNAGNSPTYAAMWPSPYTGQIGLRVTDNLGHVSTASVYTRITVSDLKPVSYPLISSARINRNVWEYVYRFTIKNQGSGDATNVSAVLQNWPSQVTVIDGSVTFGTVAAGQTVASSDTFTVRIDRSVAVSNNDLSWKLTFTVPGGSQYVLVNFPLY